MEAEHNKSNEDGTGSPEETKVVEESTSGGATTGVVSSETKKSPVQTALIIIAGALLAVGLVLYFGDFNNVEEPDSSVTTDPDQVLAIVNGESILQKEVDERISESEQVFAAQNINISDPTVRAQISAQIVDDIINFKLLSKGAEAAGVVSDAELVESEIANYILQAGSEEAFESELEQVGLTRDAFQERVTEQLVLQKYIAESIDAENISVTDDEISAFYDNVVAGQEGAPPLTEIRDQIEIQLVTDKQQQAVQEFIATIRAEADIVVN